MKSNHLVTSAFQWISFLMTVINCVPVNNASSSSQEIDEDRSSAESVLQHLCRNWFPHRMRGTHDHLDSECGEKCGHGKGFLLPDKKTLICYTKEEPAGVISFKKIKKYGLDQSECECGSALYGRYYEGRQKKTSCENIPYRIKTKRDSILNCKENCKKVTMFKTKNRPNTGLEWCDEHERNSVFNNVKLRGVVKGRFLSNNQYKCWCGLAIEDIQPSMVPMPTSGQDYWLREGFKPSSELNENVSQIQELNSISNISSNNSTKQETTLGGMCSNNIGSGTQDMISQTGSKKINRDISLKYYDFLHPSSQSCDKKLKVTNHDDDDMAKENSMKSREEITIISNEEFQLSVKSSNREMARKKQEKKFVRTSTQDEHLRVGTINHKTRHNKQEDKVFSTLEENLQLRLGLGTPKFTYSNPRSETNRKLTQDRQFGIGSSNQILGHAIPQTEASATLGSDLHLGLGLSSQKIARNSINEQMVNIASISNCHDFLSLKPSSQYNIEKNVSNVDSNKNK